MEERMDNGFVAFEYITVQADQELAQLYKDCYKNLGWIQAEENTQRQVPGAAYIKPGSVALKFKRDRTIRKVDGIERLQQECDHALTSIKRLEKAKTSRAIINALITGLIGTCFVGGAVFSYLDSRILLCIFLGLIGFAGWGAAYPLYNNVYNKVTAEAGPLIEEQYERLYQACEQASRLLT
ncbi:hypothetical protein [Paenibacillus sp. FSL R10-2736]|uniref:hypothetical protein n=1 Tax=Paenibacillus sp. FSL R10-2736 TaxID=2954692 RepID=UPI0030FBEC26